MAKPQPRTVAYVVSRFPVLTETFVVTEMDAISRLGVDLDLYAIIAESPAVVSEASARWTRQVRTLPWLSRPVVRANLTFVGRDPSSAIRLAGAVGAGHVKRPKLLASAVALGPKSVAFGEDMKRRGVAHVHAHFGTHAALSAMIAAQAAGIPYSFTVHAYDLFLDSTFLIEKVRAAAFVSTISEFNRRRLADLAPDAADRIHVVRCGVRPRLLASRPDGARADAPRVLTVAALHRYKGLQYLIEAADLLRARYPGLSVVIVGEGPERARLEQLRDRLGLRATVRFVGAIPAEDVPTYLAESDIFVLPSVQEPSGNMDGIPVALMEAMAADVPVVASNLGGIPELVRDGDTGVLAPPGDAEGLAAAIERLWLDPGLRAACRAAGRRWVIEEFGVDVNAQRLLDLFEATHGRGLREL